MTSRTQASHLSSFLRESPSITKSFGHGGFASETASRRKNTIIRPAIWLAQLRRRPPPPGLRRVAIISGLTERRAAPDHDCIDDATREGSSGHYRRGSARLAEYDSSLPIRSWPKVFSQIHVHAAAASASDARVLLFNCSTDHGYP
jgi:hypothetical protein